MGFAKQGTNVQALSFDKQRSHGVKKDHSRIQEHWRGMGYYQKQMCREYSQ
jgi:hypothetical protein